MKVPARIVAAAVAVVALVTLVWFLVGGRSFEHEYQVTIDVPPRAIFLCLSDTDVQQRWMGGGVKVEPLTEGGHKVGARTKLTFLNGNSTFDTENEVLETEPNKHLKVKVDGSVFTLTTEYDLQPSPSGTVVTQRAVGHFTGFARFAAPFLGTPIQDKLREDLDVVKRTLEATPNVEQWLTRPR